MAYKGKTIFNSKTGQEIKFLQTGLDTSGELLEMEATYHSHSTEPAAHYHPVQVEDFTVLSGELTIRMGGQLTVLRQGDTIQIPRNKVHSMWNATSQRTVVNWKVRPALNTEYFLENLTGLANDNLTNEAGMPGLLQVCLLANRHSQAIRLTKPPFAVQKILFTLLTPLAYLLGYRPSYPRYLN